MFFETYCKYRALCILTSQQLCNISKQIPLVGERFVIKIFIKTQPIILTLLTFRSLSQTFIRRRSWYQLDRNVNKVRIIVCVLMIFL